LAISDQPIKQPHGAVDPIDEHQYQSKKAEQRYQPG